MKSERICPKCGSSNVRPGNVSNKGGFITSQNTYFCEDCGFSSVFFPVITKSNKTKKQKVIKKIKSKSKVVNKEKFQYGKILMMMFPLFILLVIMASLSILKYYGII